MLSIWREPNQSFAKGVLERLPAIVYCPNYRDPETKEFPCQAPLVEGGVSTLNEWPMTCGECNQITDLADVDPEREPPPDLEQEAEDARLAEEVAFGERLEQLELDSLELAQIKADAETSEQADERLLAEQIEGERVAQLEQDSEELAQLKAQLETTEPEADNDDNANEPEGIEPPAENGEQPPAS